MVVKSENKHHQMTSAKFGSGVAISSESMNRQKQVIRYALRILGGIII